MVATRARGEPSANDRIVHFNWLVAKVGPLVGANDRMVFFGENRGRERQMDDTFFASFSCQ